MLNITNITKSILQLTVIALLVWLLYTIRGLLFYIIIASVLALVLKPVTNWLSSLHFKKTKFPRWLAAAATIILSFVFLGGISAVAVPKLINEMSILSGIDFSLAYASILEQVSLIQNWMISNNLAAGDLLSEVQTSMRNVFNFTNAKATISNLLGGLSNLAIALFSVIFILFFFLKEQRIAERLIADYIPDDLAEHINNIIPKIKNTLFRYFIGLLLQMTGIFIIVYPGLTIVGVPGALVISLFAAFINVIPYIGPMIGAVFGIVVGLGQLYALFPDLNIGVAAIKIVIVFAITQLTDNFVYQPLIFSRSIKAHPLEIFIVISISGLLGGIAGMVIAVPGYSMIRIIAKEFFTKMKFIRSLTKNV
jgi:predicted PurR-regulated permease PerM